jgi:hypothetical protein
MRSIRVVGIAVAVLLVTISIWIASIFSTAIFRAIEVAILQRLPPGTWTQIKCVLSLLLVVVFWSFRNLLLRSKFVPSEWFGKLDANCSAILERLLAVSFAIGIVLAFLTWYPHYLFWPWWMDLEHFAVSAQMWDLGVRPYRDLFDFNFPGPIYFMWILGKAFGWGRPMIANAFDGLVVMGMCSVLIIWSRKRFASATAGLFASLLVIRYYFSLDYARVMQRDWYVAVLGISSICLIQSSESKHRWLITGLLMAVAGIVRPYAILFLLPIGLACWLDEQGQKRLRFRNGIRIAISMAVGTLCLWLPVVLHGLFDDFLTTFAEAALTESYRSKKQESVIQLLIRQSNTKIVFTGLTGLIATSFLQRRDPDRCRITFVWLCALVSTLFYMTICPVRHAYTEIPAEMVACVGCGITLKFLIDQASWAGSVKLVSILVWFIFQFPGLPQYCSSRASLHAIQAFAKGEMIEEPPPGCRYVLGTRDLMGAFRYNWEDYTETIEYVRKRTSKDTYIVNFLWLHPNPTINGPTGRPVLWPCAEGLLWVLWVDPKLEMRFADSLVTDRPVVAITHDESVVPSSACPFPIIAREIETSFEEIARFGKFRISKRRSDRSRSISNDGSRERQEKTSDKAGRNP